MCSSDLVDFNQECTDNELCSTLFSDKYVCVEKHCRRKFLDFGKEEILGLVIITVLIAMTNSGGVGAGTAVSPTLVVLFFFPLVLAIPQARVTIMTGSLITFIMTGFSRKSNSCNRFQTDYSLAAVLTPLLLAGSHIGVIFARYLPSLIISVLLIAYICYSLLQTYKRATKERKRETKVKTGENQTYFDQPRISNVSFTDYSVSATPKSTTDNDVPPDSDNGKELEKDNSLEVKSKTEMFKEQIVNFALLLLAITVFVVASLMKGGRTIKSIVGVEECSLASWGVLLVSQIICIAIAGLAYLYNRATFSEMDNEIMTFRHIDDNNEMSPQEARIRLIAATYLAGVISGFIGVGGGMILGLYMLAVGLDVYSSTALSNFIVLISSSATSFQFLAIGAIQLDNSLIFIGIALIGSIAGNLLFKRILKRLQKPSLIVWLLFGVLWLAFAALSYEAYTNIQRKGKAVLMFGKFC